MQTFPHHLAGPEISYLRPLTKMLGSFRNPSGIISDWTLDTFQGHGVNAQTWDLSHNTLYQNHNVLGKSHGRTQQIKPAHVLHHDHAREGRDSDCDAVEAVAALHSVSFSDLSRNAMSSVITHAMRCLHTETNMLIADVMKSGTEIKPAHVLHHDHAREGRDSDCDAVEAVAALHSVSFSDLSRNAMSSVITHAMRCLHTETNMLIADVMKSGTALHQEGL